MTRAVTMSMNVAMIIVVIPVMSAVGRCARIDVTRVVSLRSCTRKRTAFLNDSDFSPFPPSEWKHAISSLVPIQIVECGCSCRVQVMRLAHISCCYTQRRQVDRTLADYPVVLSEVAIIQRQLQCDRQILVWI